MTGRIYFTRLLEFAAGLLIILIAALLAIVLVYMKKIRSIGGHIHPDTADQVKNMAKEKATLEKELEVLKKKIIQEQQVRKKMEAEVAGLLARMKKR